MALRSLCSFTEEAGTAIRMLCLPRSLNMTQKKPLDLLKKMGYRSDSQRDEAKLETRKGSMQRLR